MMPMRQTEAVKEIMGKCVAKKSLANYALQNACFAMFCLEDDNLHAILLEMWFVEKIAVLMWPSEKICTIMFAEMQPRG